MRVSLFVEIALPRPWEVGTEQDAFAHYLDVIELADKAGFSTAWVTEHHFLEEYAHASAPEVFLGAASQRTSRIRLGHGIVHMPPNINHPARVAERISTLDLVSGGRVEFGTGEASSVAELGGFGVDPGKKRAMWTEAIQVATRCMAESPFTGFSGEFVNMPSREVVPHPVQKPHPPVWVACTRPATIDMAASYGMGALSFALQGPDESRRQSEAYYATFADKASPITPGMNPNIMFQGGNLLVAASDDEARRRASNSEGFFGYGVAYYYVHGMHHPGQVNLWSEYLKSIGATEEDTPGVLTDSERREDWGAIAAKKSSVGANAFTEQSSGVGSVETLRACLLKWEESGCDELCFLLPPVQHDWVLASIELAGKSVLPEFIERHEAKTDKDRARKEVLIEKAEARRVDTAPAHDPDYAFGGVPVAFDSSAAASEVADNVARAEALAARSGSEG